MNTCFVAFSLLLALVFCLSNAEANIILKETFDVDYKEKGWKVGTNGKYTGEWGWSVPKTYPASDEDRGVQTGGPARHYGLIKEFDTPIKWKNNNLVVQYEVKAAAALTCSGAYIKLLINDEMPENAADFDDRTGYGIMFGPDKCGVQDRVHLIIRHQNPITKEWEEKHLNQPPTVKNDELSHVYTLILKNDNTFEILIDNEQVKSGSLMEDFTPSFIPPKEIDDPNDSKPSNWIDEEFMDDPEATKPDDWDENAPERILDSNDEKPDSWLDDEPLTIPDPEANKPEDWDDEEDGDWEAPHISNPKCTQFGCGIWKQRTIANPAFKGKWKPPQIKNPEYKGVWAPRKIPNPGFFESCDPNADMPALGAIALDLWSMDRDITFDNFYIGYDIEDAAEFREKTWGLKYPIEKAQMPEPPAPSSSNGFIETALEFIKGVVPAGVPLSLIGTILAILVSIPCFGCFYMYQKITAVPEESDIVYTKEDGEAEKEIEESSEDEEEEEELIKASVNCQLAKDAKEDSEEDEQVNASNVVEEAKEEVEDEKIDAKFTKDEDIEVDISSSSSDSDSDHAAPVRRRNRPRRDM